LSQAVAVVVVLMAQAVVVQAVSELLRVFL
jgi:hypothetical protein